MRRYVNELDGLRAISVAAVVVFHARESAMPGALVWLNLFFVISGFLITSILLREHRQSGRIDLRSFWIRRVRRLAPAILVLVSVTSLVAVALGELSTLGFVDAVGALTWTQNWAHLWASTTRWGLRDPRTPLDHLWSLAVEEQFYLVWPLALGGLLRFVPRTAARVGAVVAVALGSVGVSIWLGYGGYFRTDARAYELLAGALLAWVSWRPGPRLAAVVPAMALGVLTWFTLFVDVASDWLYPWGLLVTTLAGGSLVLCSTVPPRWLTALCGGPLAAVGRRSYGIYLWHVPILRLMTEPHVGFGGPALRLVQLLTLVVVVEGSYRFVEQPIRTGRVRLGAVRSVACGAAVVVALVPAGIVARDGVRRQYDAVNRPVVPAGSVRVLVVGDGGAAALGRGLTAGTAGAAAPTGSTRDPASRTVWNTALWNCGLLSGRSSVNGRAVRLDEACDHWTTRWGHAVDDFRPDVVVVMVTTWDLFDRDGSLRDQATAAVRDATRILTRHGARVIWVEPVLLGSLPAASDEETARWVAAAETWRAVLAESKGIEVRSISSAPSSQRVSEDEVTAAAATVVGEG